MIGSPRSGTSAIAWALAQHPRLWTSSESDFLLYFCQSISLQQVYATALNRPSPGWLSKNSVTENEFYEAIGSGLDQLFRSRSGGKDWIDQTPSYTLIATELSRLFPNASFIHMVRDGRKVVKSMNASGFEKEGFEMPWTTSFQEACRSWGHYFRVGRSFVEANPARAIEVRNEDLLVSPEETIYRLLEFLEYPPHQGPADFLKKKRINSSYARDIQQRAEEIWKETWLDWSSEEQDCFMRLCGKELMESGYISKQQEL